MKCFDCGEELEEIAENYNYKHAEYCCSGHNCGCMGLPIDPPYCIECIIEGLENRNRILEAKLKVKG